MVKTRSRHSRLISMLLVVAMLTTLFCGLCLEAHAASSVSGTVTYSSRSAGINATKNIKVTTGRGLTYFFGKKTTVTIKNTGKWGSLTLYQWNSGLFSGTYVHKCAIYPGQTKTLTISGNGKDYAYFVQAPDARRYKTTFSVSVSAGSCSIS